MGIKQSAEWVRKRAEALDKRRVSMLERGSPRKNKGVLGTLAEVGKDAVKLGGAAAGSVKSEFNKRTTKKGQLGILNIDRKVAGVKDYMADRRTDKAKENLKTSVNRLGSKSKAAVTGAASAAVGKVKSGVSFAKQNVATRGGNTKTKLDDKAYALAGKIKRAPGVAVNAVKQNIATRGGNTKTKLDDKAYALAARAKKKVKSWMD